MVWATAASRRFVSQSFAGVEKASGTARQDALNALATKLDGDASSSPDARKVRKLQDAVRQLTSGTAV